jgi:hypothetical protein
MAIPPAGTFDYVAWLPARSAGWAVDEWRAPVETRVPVVRRRSDLFPDQLWDRRLVGYSPALVISSELIALFARPNDFAGMRRVSFAVDRGFVELLQSGDRVHLARSESAQLAVSVLRDERLIVAFGAVRGVPLGDGMALEPLGVRDAAGWLDRLEFVGDRWTKPTILGDADPCVEITVHGQTRVFAPGERFDVAGLFVWITHGVIFGSPGEDVVGALARIEECPREVAVKCAEAVSDRRLVMTP